jgi:hypothetical protein
MSGDTSLPMPFGKHKGVAVEDLPCHYIRWALEEIQASPRNKALREALTAEQAFRQKNNTTVKEAGGSYVRR